MPTYQTAAVGGTFDRLHAGHHQLLKTALDAAENVIIGITSPVLNRNKPLSHLIQSLSTRKKHLRNYLKDCQVLHRVTIITLTDPFGPALTNQSIDCLVVSKQTKAGGEKLNQARAKRNQKPLPPIIANMVHDRSGQYLSSTRIREGKVNRDGIVYAHLFDQDIYFQPTHLARLKRPQSTKYQTNQLNQQLFANTSSIHLIGDLVTKLFLDKKWPFSLAVIDHKSHRQPTAFTLKPTIIIEKENQPGSINSHIAKKLQKIYQDLPQQQIVSVQGEEDLLAFVPCLSEPLNSLVIYGHPQGGVVIIRLTETNKEKFYRIILDATKGEK
jgi:pantetheine-phosphate adenylyltransferase